MPLLASALAIYAVGISMAAIALVFGSKSIEAYMGLHEGQANNENYLNTTEGKNESKMADRLWRRATQFIFSSLIIFALSSIWLACGFVLVM